MCVKCQTKHFKSNEFVYNKLNHFEDLHIPLEDRIAVYDPSTHVKKGTFSSWSIYSEHSKKKNAKHKLFKIHSSNQKVKKKVAIGKKAKKVILKK